MKTLDNWVKLADFLQNRGDVTPNTAATYMRRHKEEFDGHTKRKNSRSPLFIDATAQALLSDVYPLRSATVVEGVPQAEYDDLKAKYDKLTESITGMANNLLKAQEQTLEVNRQLIELQKEQNLLLIEQKNTEDELKRLKNRNLIQRILNKDA